jgi:hypothetical protein
MIAHLMLEGKNLPLQREKSHSRENCPLPHSGQFRCQKGLSTIEKFIEMTHCTVLPKTKKNMLPHLIITGTLALILLAGMANKFQKGTVIFT